MNTKARIKSVAPSGKAGNGLRVNERAVFEAALREAERKYRDIFDNASEGIFQTTPDGRFLTANPAMAATLGFSSPEELIKARTNISREHYVNPEKRREFEQLLTENGSVRDFVHEAYRKDGTRIWLSENVRAVHDENGSVRYYEGTSTDITERKRAEESLYESEERYRDLVENSLELICTHDLQGRILSANRAAIKLMGYDSTSRDATNCRDLLAVEVRDQFDTYLAKIQSEGKASGLMLVQTVTGEKRIWEYDCTLRTQGVAAPIVRGMARDITERKQAEAALRQSERDYRGLFNQAHDAIFVLCAETEIVLDVNERACEMYGFSRAEFIGMSMEAISKYPGQGKAKLVETMEQGQCLNFDTVQYRRDGTEIHLEINASMVLYNGQMAVLSINRDTTERKRTEAALRASERFRRTIIESEPECVKIVAPDCTVLEMNPAGLGMVGATSLEQVVGLSVLNLVAPQCRDAYLDLHERVCHGESAVGEYEVIGLTGERLWMETHAVPLRNEDSEVIAQLAITRDVTARKRYEESLQLFRSLLDRSSDAIEVIDPVTMQFLDCNESAYRCLGHSREEFLALTVFDIDPKVDRALLAQLDKEIERNGFATLESLHRRKDGSTFPVEVNVTNVQLERTYRLAVVRDITERKRAEADSRRQSEILEKIVAHIPVMINFTGSDGRIKLVNQEWQNTLGWSLEEVVDQGADVFAECYPDPAYRAEVFKFVAACDGQWGDFKTKVRDGRVIDTSWARVQLSDGTTIGIGRDITAQKEAERAVREAEQKYRELFENARDALYLHDLDGRYTSVNRAAESLTGYDREEILGKDFVGFVARKHISRVRKNLCKKLEEEGETTYEVEIITKDGRRIPVEVSSHLIYRNAIPVGVQGAVRDISDRKKAQESLQSFSRRLLVAQEAERQRIARTLHDEIGQVLTAVKINLQTHGSLDSIDSAARITESIDIIDEALVRVRDLSIDLRPPHLDDFGLSTALRWYVDTYSQRTGTAAKFSDDLGERDRRLPQEIETACFRIAQEALTNITRHAAASSVSIKLIQRREQLRLTITDNGIGFDVPAVTGRTSAETLGLRGMKERIQAVGGSLEIESTLGKGTQVRALFPIPATRK